MDPLFYDDLECGSSLFQSPTAKKDLYATLNENLRGKLREEKERNGNGNRREGNPEMGDVLKNGGQPTILHNQFSQMDHEINCFNRIIRPCTAEFIAVFFCIFIGKVMEDELTVHVTSSNIERIILQALTDALVMFAMLTAFQTVHLNPVITLAEFFALTTAWPMCCAMIIMQMLASVTAVAGFVVLRSSNTELKMPSIISDITVDYIDAPCRLILSQFIGALLVVITHLIITVRTGSGLTALARSGNTPFSVGAAVFVSSLLCLLNSNIGWNPLLAFALASYGSIDCNFRALQMQGIFWIGPCLASLFACFMYRLLFATKESRLVKCTHRFANN